MSQIHEHNPDNNQGETPSQVPIKNLIIIGGEKGGTGKSHVSRYLIGFFLRKQWGEQITVFDADPSVDDVYQVYQKSPWMKKIEFSDNKYKVADSFDIYQKSDNKPLVVVNLPSNIQKNFNNFFETFGLFEKEIQQQVYETAYYLFVSDGSYQSIKLFREHLQRYKNQSFIKTVLILNEGQNGQSESFSYLETIESESSKGFIREVNEFKIPILLMPELIPSLRYIIDKLLIEQGMSFEEIVRGNQLNILWSSHYQKYLGKIDSLFNDLFESPEKVKYQSLQQKQAKERSDTSLPLQKTS